MSQDAPGTPTTFVMAATLTSEADLKAWYLANNPTLRRSHGLSCPPALYKEMKRDLRGRFRTTVAIVFLFGDFHDKDYQWPVGECHPCPVVCSVL